MLIHVPPASSVLAMDVHKNSISTAMPGSTSLVTDRIGTDEESVRRLVARFDDPLRVWACYEAPRSATGAASRRPPCSWASCRLPRIAGTPPSGPLVTPRRPRFRPLPAGRRSTIDWR